MKSRSVVVTVVLAALMAAPVVLLAQRATRIQLGSILPANSIWDRSLKEMAVEWRDETDGRVQLRVRSGAFRDEAALARRLKRGRPQAAVFGLPGDIHEAFSVLNIPFFFESDEEVFHVVEALNPTFERVLADEGLVLLNWGHAGWAHFFSDDRVETLDDLRRTKVFTAAGDDKMLQWYKENGFDPEPLAVTDVLLGLNTGLINAHPSPPYVALLFQWFDKTPFMLDVPLAPVLGITVMAEPTWSLIDPDDQAVLRASAKRLEQELLRDVAAQERGSIEEMKKRGLTVVEIDAAARAAFRAVADEMTASWRGNLIPADVYDMAVQARDSFRAGR
jgi:TRAP-type C4-dicarboxylate transport system substrate-binding protein